MARPRVDPDQNVRQQLHFAEHLLKAKDGKEAIDLDDVWELADLVVRLDAHLAAGGDLPKRWE